MKLPFLKLAKRGDVSAMAADAISEAELKQHAHELLLHGEAKALLDDGCDSLTAICVSVLLPQHLAYGLEEGLHSR